jgi:hypothetical protein
LLCPSSSERTSVTPVTVPGLTAAVLLAVAVATVLARLPRLDMLTGLV